MHDGATTDRLKMSINQIMPDKILRGTVFPEPVEDVGTLPPGEAGRADTHTRQMLPENCLAELRPGREIL